MSTALVPAPSVRGLLVGAGPAANPMAAAFADEVKGQELTTERDVPELRIDHARARFTMKGIDVGETIEGYCVHYFQQRAFWENQYNPKEAGGPDCSSVDMIVPLANSKKVQAPDCASCPHAQFKSAKNGEGQACKTNTFLVLVNPLQFAPQGVAVLVVPPSSIMSILGSKKEAGFIGKAKSFRMPGGAPAQYYQIVYSRFHLERTDGPYCVVEGEPLSMPEDAEEAKAIGAVRGKVMDAIKSIQKRVINAEAA